MYTNNRLEWHLDDESTKNPAGYCVVLQGGKRDFCRFNRLAAALAKSQDHRAFCGVFAFGQPNAVRRWLVLRYPVTRASQSRERGRIPRARWLRIVWDSVLRWHGSVGQTSKAQSEPVFSYGKAVLCSNIHHGSVQRYRTTSPIRSTSCSESLYISSQTFA